MTWREDPSFRSQNQQFQPKADYECSEVSVAY